MEAYSDLNIGVCPLCASDLIDKGFVRSRSAKQYHCTPRVGGCRTTIDTHEAISPTRRDDLRATLLDSGIRNNVTDIKTGLESELLDVLAPKINVLKRQQEIANRLASNKPFIFRNPKSRKLYNSIHKKTMNGNETATLMGNASKLQSQLSSLIEHFEEIVDKINNFDDWNSN